MNSKICHCRLDGALFVIGELRFALDEVPESWRLILRGPVTSGADVTMLHRTAVSGECVRSGCDTARSREIDGSGNAVLRAKAYGSRWCGVLSVDSDGGAVVAFEPLKPERHAARGVRNAWHLTRGLVPARWFARTVVCVAVAMLHPQPRPKIGPIYLITFAGHLLCV